MTSTSQSVPVGQGLAVLFCVYGIMLLPVNPDLAVPVFAFGPCLAGFVAGRKGPRPVAQGALCGAMGSSAVAAISNWVSSAQPDGGRYLMLFATFVLYSALAGAVCAAASAYLVRVQSNRHEPDSKDDSGSDGG
jgi:hypothetical protein